MFRKILSWLFGTQTVPLSIKGCPRQAAEEFPHGQATIEEALELAARQNLDIKVSVKPPSDRPERRPRKPKVILPATITGQLTHKKVYTFGVTNSGQTTTTCHVCLDRHYLFSIAVDSAGVEHRCCLRCLHKLGGKDQLDRATERSHYAAIVWNWCGTRKGARDAEG